MVWELHKEILRGFSRQEISLRDHSRQALENHMLRTESWPATYKAIALLRVLSLWPGSPVFVLIFLDPPFPHVPNL